MFTHVNRNVWQLFYEQVKIEYSHFSLFGVVRFGCGMQTQRGPTSHQANLMVCNEIGPLK